MNSQEDCGLIEGMMPLDLLSFRSQPVRKTAPKINETLFHLREEGHKCRLGQTFQTYMNI
jgi:hypothetical protein